MTNRIAEVRKAIDMSQEELAKKSGISRTYLSQIGTQKQKVVGSDVMFSIAKALGEKYENIFLP